MDTNPQCAAWAGISPTAATSQCVVNARFMAQNCQQSCGLCGGLLEPQQYQLLALVGTPVLPTNGWIAPEWLDPLTSTPRASYGGAQWSCEADDGAELTCQGSVPAQYSQSGSVYVMVQKGGSAAPIPGAAVVNGQVLQLSFTGMQPASFYYMYKALAA